MRQEQAGAIVQSGGTSKSAKSPPGGAVNPGAMLGKAHMCKVKVFAGAPCATGRADPSRNTQPLFGAVGCLTVSASRQPQCQCALDEWDSTRYLETIVKLGEAYVLIISLYLHAKDESWYIHRKDASDSLLQRALERVTMGWTCDNCR